LAHESEKKGDRDGEGQGSGFRVQGSGFRVQGSGFRVQELQKDRKQEAGTGTPSTIIPARARPHTRTHTIVIPAQAGIHVPLG
jgi:hypothetical protein